MADNIILENICKSYNGNKVLDNFCARFERGSVTGIMAPSGAGKTTLLRIMMGLETQDSGNITGMEGVRISTVFQEDRLIDSLCVMANISLVNAKPGKEEIGRTLEAFGLVNCADQKACELSGGMKRRVAIIRALMAEYDVLLLDEPFKGLDSDTKIMVIGQLLGRTKGKTIIIVTHNEVELALMHIQKVIKL